MSNPHIQNPATRAAYRTMAFLTSQLEEESLPKSEEGHTDSQALQTPPVLGCAFTCTPRRKCGHEVTPHTKVNLQAVPLCPGMAIGQAVGWTRSATPVWHSLTAQILAPAHWNSILHGHLAQTPHLALFILLYNKACC